MNQLGLGEYGSGSEEEEEQIDKQGSLGNELGAREDFDAIAHS
jgi:hypothetical protein